MWQIENHTPFGAERAWARDRDGAEVWLVAIKATFDIAPDGGLTIADQQPPPEKTTVYFGEPGRSSVRYESDLVLTKKTTDIVVVGHAHAPEGRPVSELDVGLRVGGVRKVIKVFGDRLWGDFGAGSGRPFVKMPLVYERAFGGAAVDPEDPERDWDWRNPVGCGYARRGGAAVGVPLPNLESTDRLINAWTDRPAPAGFGAIGCHWQPRLRHAGTYDQHWLDERQPLWPEDLDDRYFQCAPEDQQSPAFMVGGEPVALLNMTQGGGLLRFQLPRLHLGFETRFQRGERELHTVRRLHTVIFEPDAPRVSLVWHSALPCHQKVYQLDRTVVTLKTALNTRRWVEDDRDDGLLG
ncbi:MAG TPA: DUF2169 domain-containing protein [Ideonella sp.]|uniref:DUF2169 family type VI secretion system accessory protein n=1 Tax=Ideonella sp. TaxID=1929293 RepID=UPI002B6A6D96|nr:DUF2169 domain-containing protein [Ideonella sp.]HSI49050.1 DUF2169 domain-containing protein [Ideonella sp.]